MKAVIYARYSPGPNQKDKSVEEQIADCRQFARENDIMIVGDYADRKRLAATIIGPNSRRC